MEQDPPFPLTPSCFLATLAPLHALPQAKAALSKKYQLPHESKLLVQERFADVFMGWCAEGIALEVRVDKPWEKAVYPELKEGDSIELFIDTRDRKQGALTRFCHHFFFSAKPIEGLLGAEISTFRDLDAHDLCDPHALEVTPSFTLQGYSLKVWIPASCLHGYDPATFDRLGFTYRINRPKGDAQTFAISERDAPFDNHPARFATLKLVP